LNAYTREFKAKNEYIMFKKWQITNAFLDKKNSSFSDEK
jgi:hypothetical protein